jgi:ActR/RegA family two-component response regulator
VAGALFFVGDDVGVRDDLARAFAERGWQIGHGTASPDTADLIAQTQPVACVFSLDGSETAALLDLAENVSADERLERPLLVFSGGHVEDVASVKTALPYAVFVRPDELEWVLKHLIPKT